MMANRQKVVMREHHVKKYQNVSPIYDDKAHQETKTTQNREKLQLSSSVIINHIQLEKLLTKCG